MSSSHPFVGVWAGDGFPCGVADVIPVGYDDPIRQAMVPRCGVASVVAMLVFTVPSQTVVCMQFVCTVYAVCMQFGPEVGNIGKSRAE